MVLSYSTSLTAGLLAPVSGARVDLHGVTAGASAAHVLRKLFKASVWWWP